MRIKKTSATTPVQAQVVNTYNESQANAYSCDYVNDLTDGTKPMGSIVVDDVSCKNIANNLINPQTINGVTITKNNNGTLTLNGTSTQAFVLTIDKIDLKAGNTYTISGVENASDSFVRFDMRISSGGNIYNDWVLPTKPTYTISSDVTLYFSMRVGNGAVFSNTTLYPMVEIGDEATSYTPYKAFGEEIYSTNEMVIGKWVDGKPLYRKVFKGTLANSTQTNVVTLNNEKLKIAYGNYNYGGNILFFGKSDNQASLQTRIQVTTQNILVLYHTTDIGGSAYELVIEYTKTTD